MKNKTGDAGTQQHHEAALKASVWGEKEGFYQKWAITDMDSVLLTVHHEVCAGHVQEIDANIDFPHRFAADNAATLRA